MSIRPLPVAEAVAVAVDTVQKRVGEMPGSIPAGRRYTTAAVMLKAEG